MCSGDAICGRVAAGPGGLRRVEGGHRICAAVLLIQPETVARQDDPVERCEEPDGSGCRPQDQADLRQFRARNG
ncbi:MAG TPA: hypothetical protein VK496_03315, partial [Gaiellaceae bacterium]|nr:hypothetical protein [Gaiellaceae bacterium]